MFGARFALFAAGAALAFGADAKISIGEHVLSQFEDGPGAGAYEFSQGEAVFVRLRFAGYSKSKDKDDRERLHLTWRVEAFDAEGVPVVEAKSDKVDAELAAQDRNWMPKVRHDFLLPPLADSGMYKVVATVKDELNGSTARVEMPFKVNAPAVEKSETLVVRNFRFLRGEDDAAALKTAAYRSSDPLWARFEMTGYKLGEGNAFSVSYGLEVLGAGGRSMYSEPNAAKQEEKTFYRKRYAPGVLNLNLKETPKGEYTIVLRVRDESGGQTAESKHTFTVE